KMVEKGQVDSATFQKVIAENIGGAAQKMGNSTGGAFKNMQAAIGRLGAKLAGPIFDQVPRVFNGITGAIDTAGQSIGPVMDRLGDTFGKVFGDKIVPLLDEVGPIAGDVFSKIGDTAKAAAPSLIEVGKGVGDFLGKAWDAVESVLPTMGNMFKTVWESIRGIVVTVSPAVSKALKPIFSSLGNLTKALAPVARVLMTVLGGAFKGLAAVLGPVAKILLNVAGAVLPKVIDSVTWLVNKLTAVGPVFKTVFSAIGESAMWLWNNAIKPAWDGIVSVIKGAWSVLQVPFRLAKFAFEVLGAAATWLWQNAIVPAWDGIKAAVSAAWDFIQPVLEPFKTAFSAVGDAAMWLWNNAIVPAWDGIKAAFSSAWDFVSGIFDKLKTGFNTAKGVIVGVANAIGDGVKSAFSGLAAIIKAPLHALGSFLAGVPSSVLGVEIPYASTLQSWGKNLQGLAGGGLVRGPGSGTSDSVLAWLSNGEGVLTAKAMGKDGVPQLMSALNAGWVPSIGLLHSMLPGFKTGGMVGPDVQAAMGLTGTKYSQGVRNDCSGMAARVINRALNLPDDSLMTTKNAAQWLTARGFVKGRGGPGTIRVGWYDHGPNPNDGHMAMTLSDGQNAESGGSVGSFTVGGAAAGADSPQFDQHMYLPNPYGEGPALGGVGGSLAQLGGASSGGSAGGSVTSPITKAAENFKDAAGQLADIGVGGLSESLLPDGFSNPMEWGALKAGATLLKFFGGLTKDPFAKGALNIAGSALSGSGSGVVDAISGMIPQPFGSLPAAQPNDFEGNVGGGGGSLASGAANMAAQFVPSSNGGGGDGWQGVQNNFNGPVGANASDVANKINSGYNQAWRQNFSRGPGAP
ncbi:phage tail protein, partial [Mycobacteroides chelonae]